MRLPTLNEAEQLMADAATRNPGPWTAHSYHVGNAARRIAALVPGMQSGNACILGMLHDLGRREGVTGMRHVLDGYTYLNDLGYVDAARICMTHSFQNRDHREIFGEWDCTTSEVAFIQSFLDRTELDDYDRLIQMCDSLATASGFVLMEKRMMDVALRYGVNQFSVRKWRKTFEIRADFEKRIGCTVYSLLPGVVDNTFER